MRINTLTVIISLILCVQRLDAGGAVAPDNLLDNWIREVQKPGFVLLAKAHEKEMLFAVFNAGNDYIAVCHKNINRGPEQSHSRTDIKSEAGRGLMDDSRETKRIEWSWKRPIPGGFTGGTSLDGKLYPILHFNGVVVVTFEFIDDTDSTKDVQITKKIQL